MYDELSMFSRGLGMRFACFECLMFVQNELGSTTINYLKLQSVICASLFSFVT